MSYKIYSDEQIEWVRLNAPNKSNKELAILFNEQFKTDLMTHNKIKQLKNNNKIKGRKSLFTEKQIEFIKTYGENVRSIDLTKMINDHFSTDFEVSKVENKRYQLGVKSNFDPSILLIKHGQSTRFKKGEIRYPENQIKPGERRGIKTEFKKGNKPHSTLPVGTEMMKSDGYWYRKVKETTPGRLGWKQMHRIVWEEHHGPIPERGRVIFIDRNKNNLDISNLRLADIESLAVINKHYKLTDNIELNETSYLMAKVTTMQSKILKEMKS